MVKILIRRTDRQGDIKVKGHAGGLNENGSDIVCAGVSTITTLFAQVLEDAGVFKRNEAGRAAFRCFLGTADQEGSL